MSRGLTERQRVEAAVYDGRVEARLGTLTPADLVVTSPYPNREHLDFLGEALKRISPLAGKRILEPGCGTGALSVWLAQQGATVTGIDVSERNIGLARRRAEANGVEAKISFRAVPVEQLQDADGSYDAIIGNQVLHHFELAETLPVLRRLLKPGGSAVFCEPIMLLPSAFRRLRDHPAVVKRFPRVIDTPTERTISRADLDLILASFPHSSVSPFQMFTRLHNFWRLDDGWFARLHALDRFVLRRFKPGVTLSRFVVVELSHEDHMKRGVT